MHLLEIIRMEMQSGSVCVCLAAAKQRLVMWFRVAVWIYDHPEPTLIMETVEIRPRVCGWHGQQSQTVNFFPSTPSLSSLICFSNFSNYTNACTCVYVCVCEMGMHYSVNLPLAKPSQFFSFQRWKSVRRRRDGSIQHFQGAVCHSLDGEGNEV